MKVKERVEYLLKHNSVVLGLYKTVVGAFVRCIGMFVKQDEHLVLLSSFSGKRYNDSPKVLYETMKDMPEFSGFRFVWAFVDATKYTSDGLDTVTIDSLSYFVTALKAKYWITNVNIERGLKFKKSGTIYINTWHGTGPKTSGNAVAGRTDYDFSDVDIITCDGEYLANIMVRDHKARPESILLCGRPREDELYHLMRTSSKRDAKLLLGLDPNSMMILYAPTWREFDGRDKTAVDNQYPIHVEKWTRTLGEDTVIGFRAHSLASSAMVNDKRIRDFSEYDDINVLFMAADVLISDYSAVFTDFSILKKPMICYCYDYDHYKEARGLYFDPRDWITSFTDEDEMLSYFKIMDIEDESEKSALYFKRFAGFGGDATRTCIERMRSIKISKE